MTTSPSPSAGAGDPPTELDRNLLLIASVVVLGAIMSILDVTVVNVAINTLARDFDTDLPTIQWVATGYTLALATVIPLSGWGADRFGTKRLYMTSLALFVAGSVLSGLAWSAESLIAFRVLQGFGGGMIMPVGMTILTRAAGPQRIGRVMALIGIPMLLGPIAGPILGGWLVDDFSWRWIFFINLPIGIAALIAAARILPGDVAQAEQRLDVVGLALLSPGLAIAIYGLAESGANGGFGHAEVIVPIVVGLALLAAFVRHALRFPEPLIDLRLFANRVFSASSLTLVLTVIAVFGGMLLLPLYLQAVRGESAMATGLLLAPQGLGAMLAMPLAGRLSDRTGVGKIVPVGLTLIALSFLALTQLTDSTSYWTFGGVLFVMGIGMGATMMPIFSGALQSLRSAAVARASTTLNINQQVGASIGTAVMSVLLATALADRLPGMAGGGIGEGASLPPELRAEAAAAMADAFASTFWWALGLVVVALAVAVALLPKQHVEPVSETEEEGEEGAAAPVLVH
ncbi:MAG: DHA2 family efflux MFS transporter permease subunit [Solirubrobacterales bacterium]|nr:DHA2 family efflux MFS transporter permease subunit [Solirubrobacterales bacterium]